MRKITLTCSLSAALLNLLFLVFTGSSAFAQITFSEVSYHPDSTRNSGDWVELHNYGSTPVDLSSWIFSDADPVHLFIIPSGRILQPGGYLVLSSDTMLFKSIYPNVSNVVGPFVFGLGNKGDMLRLFDAQSTPVLSMTYADSLGWPKAADGHGRTMEIRNMSGNVSDPSNWYASCMWGSPGTSPSPCNDAIVFSEINYNSHSSYDAGDWVEVRNISNAAVDISNWIFRDKNDSSNFVIPSGTVLQPGDNLVLAERLGNFIRWFPGATNVKGDFPFGLKNSKDIIRLFDAQGKLVYSLAYRSDGYWTTEPDGGGKTLELLSATGIMNDGQNWFAGCIGGSPGRVYSAACDMLDVAAAANENETAVYPNPFSSQTRIEIKNRMIADGEGISIELTDAMGRAVRKMSVVAQGSDAISIPVERGDLVNGVYFYTVSNSSAQIGSGRLIIAD